MKTIISSAALMAIATLGNAQGTVNFVAVSSPYAVSTNSFGFYPFPGGVGKISAGGPTGDAPFAYYFALLYQTAASIPASISSSTVGDWTFGALATNYLTPGSLNGGSVPLPGSTAGATYYIQLVGWSASLGTNWETVSQQFTYGWSNFGYFGMSNVGSVKTGGDGTPANAPASIFSPTGISSGFVLNGTAIPEPSMNALAGMVFLSLLAFRRK